MKKLFKKLKIEKVAKGRIDDRLVLFCEKCTRKCLKRGGERVVHEKDREGEEEEGRVRRKCGGKRKSGRKWGKRSGRKGKGGGGVSL